MSKKENRPVFLDNGERMLRLRLSNVMYVLSNRNYCAIYSASNRKECEVRMSLSQMAEVLPSEDFVQVNRSCIINVGFIDIIMGKRIIMDEGVVIDMTSAYSNALDGHIVVLRQKDSSLVR